MLDTNKLIIHGITLLEHGVIEQIQVGDMSEDDARKVYGAYRYPAHMELYVKLQELKHRIHDRQKKIKRESYSATLQAHEIVRGDLEHIKPRKLGHARYAVDYMAFENENTVREYHYSTMGRYVVPSNVHSIVWNTHIEKEQITWEFSIPKYLYGHNLAQFVPQRGSSTFHNNRFLFKYSEQIKILHKRYMDFIEDFLTDIEETFQLQSKINRYMVEVDRLDMCYNQFFKTKADAFTILEHQQKMNKKRHRSDTQFAKDYQSGLAYISQSGASFKIYHKGTEYLNVKVGDYKKHKGLNNERIEKNKNKDFQKFKKLYIKYRSRIEAIERKSMTRRITNDDFYSTKTEKIDEELKRVYKKYKNERLFDVDGLKKIMDKVLRYEITLRNDFFRYHYKMHHFRKDCTVHQKAVENYNRWHNHEQNNTDEKFTATEKENARHFKNFLSRKVRLMIKVIPKVKAKHRSGVYDLEIDTEIYKPQTHRYQGTTLEDYDIAYFSAELLMTMCKHFYKNFIQHYRIADMEAGETSLSRIETYNTKVDERIKKFEYDNRIRLMEYNAGHKRKKRTWLSTLTENERMKKGLKHLNTDKLLPIMLRMEEKNESMEQAFKKLKKSKFQICRLKAQFHKLDIHINTMSLPKMIDQEKGFHTYYWLCENYKAQKTIFINQSFINHD